MRVTSGAEIALRVAFAGVLAGGATAAYVGCFCGGCGCGDNLPPPQTFDVKFTTTCPADSGLEADAGDAAPDAADDASDGASDDASTDASAEDAAAEAGEIEAGPPCFASCAEACSALQPAGMTGEGVCDFADAGPNGVMTAHCESKIFCGGRKFDGLEAAPATTTLARMAWLEAASVHAFRRLARELAAHGAPRDLALAARACARDEIRHARLMTKLATSRGAIVPPVSAAPAPVRDLESIARENAVEGCVGETFGALQAEWRAAHEPDAEIAEAMRAIAPDELRHAALGWTIAAWIDGKLDDAARARVAAARAEAARTLVRDLERPDERALALGLSRHLWAA